jgi:hypothetical protein
MTFVGTIVKILITSVQELECNYHLGYIWYSGILDYLIG